jgi:hypothetical protein
MAIIQKDVGGSGTDAAVINELEIIGLVEQQQEITRKVESRELGDNCSPGMEEEEREDGVNGRAE